MQLVLLGRRRLEIVKRSRRRRRASLAREGGKHPWAGQTRDVVNQVLRSTKRHAKEAEIELTAPTTVRTFCKSHAQNHADHGTPAYLLQQLMGHANIATTREVHTQVSQGREREAAARNEQLLANQAAPTA